MALSQAQRARIIGTLSRDNLKRYESGDIDDDQLESYGRSLGIVEPERADFSGVTSDVDTTATLDRPVNEEGQGYWSSRVNELENAGDEIRTTAGAAIDSLQSWGQRRLSSDIYNSEDRAADAYERRPDWARDNVVGDTLYGTPFEGVAAYGDAAISRAFRGELPATTDEEVFEEGRRLRAESQANQEEVRRSLDSMAPGAGQELAEAITDFAGSPTGALSVFGGPVGGLPLAEVYQDTYADARINGLSREDARAYAAAQAAPEAIGFIPAGRFLEKFVPEALKRKVVNELSTDAAKYGVGLAKTVLGEGTEEAITQLAQTGAATAFARTSENEAARTYAQAQAAGDVWDATWRAFKAGALGGATIGSVTTKFEVAAEAGRATHAALEGFNRTSDMRAPVDEDTVPTTAITPQPIDGWEGYTEERKAAEMEAGFQTLERQGIADDLRVRAQQVPNAEASPMAQAFANARVQPVRAEEVAAEEALIPTPAVTAQEAPQAAPVPAATTPATDTEEEPAPRFSEQDLRARFGAPRRAGQGAQTTGMTADRVMSSIVNRMGGSKQANILGKLVADNKLVIVDNASQIPGGAPESAFGFYDGGTTYLVADKINPETVIGDAIYAAAHEVKHAGDFSGNADLATMKNFIGAEANKRIVDKVERLANDGNAVAQAAVRAAKAGSTAETYGDELPAYLINVAQVQRGAKGSVTGVIGDVVSAIRTAAKSRLGITDVNLDDVNYLANKMLETAALSKGDLITPLGQGSRSDPMILGEAQTGFGEAEQQGRVYTSVDGTRKFQISDADSYIKPEGLERLRTAKSGTRVTAAQVLNHPELFRNMPEAQFVRIRPMDFSESNQFGVMDDRDGSIGVSRKLLEGDTDYTMPTLRQAILHEMQHYAQKTNGTLYNINKYEGLTKEEQDTYKLFQRARTTNDGVSDMIVDQFLDFSAAVRDPNIKRAISEIAYDNNMTTFQKARDIVSLAEDADVQDQELLDLMGAFDSSIEDYRKLQPKMNPILDKMDDSYRSSLLEQEAFFTQDEADTPADKQIINPEEFFKQSRGKILGPDGVRLAMDKDVFNDMKALIGGRKSKLTGKVISGQFTGFGVLGRELGNIKELADGEAAMTAFVAEGDYGRVNRGLQKMAIAEQRASGGKMADAVKKVKDKIDAALSKISVIEDENRREAELARFVQVNPDLKPLQAALNHINKNTNEIIAARMRDPKPLSESELRKYNAMIDNRYRYFTRTYAAFQGREGQSRNTKLEREYQLAKKQAAAGKKVSAKYAESFDTYSRALRFVINNDLAVFDPEHLAKMKPEQLDYLYSTWVNDPDVLREQIKNGNPTATEDARREQFRALATAQISAVGKDVDQNELQSKGEYLVNGLLGLNEQSNPVVNYYRGLKEDQGILQKRQTVPEEIRELYGEIKDVPTKIAITLAKQGELAARMRMLATIREQGEGKWYSTEKNRSKAGNENFTEQLKGEAWGPLDGVYVEPAMAAAINEGLDMFTSLQNSLAMGHATIDRAAEAVSNRAFRFARGAASLQKYMSIVLQPFATAANAAGSPLILIQNGVTNPSHVARASKAAAKLIANQITPGGFTTRDPDLELFIKYGLLDSAIGQELRSTPTKFLKKLITDTEGHTNWQQVVRGLGKGHRGYDKLKGTITEAFSLSDAWVKPAVFLSRADTLQKFYRAEGVPKTMDEIYKEAADMTKDTTITFQRTAPVVKLGERMGVTQFAPYFQGVFRSSIYSYVQGFKDLITAAGATTPAGRMIMATSGLKKVGGAMAATTGAAAFTKMLADYWNDDEDEEKVDAARKLLFPEARFGNGVFLGKDKNGNYQFLRLSRLDPLGPLNDLMRIAMDDEANTETKQKAMYNALKDLYIAPRATASLLKGAFSFMSEEEVKNKKTKTERLLPNTARVFKNAAAEMVGHDTAETMIEFLDAFVPGALNAFDEDNRKPVEDASGQEKLAATSMLLMGGRLDTANPGLAANSAAKAVAKIQKDGRDEINEALRTSGPAAAFGRYLNAREDEYDAMLHLKDVYDGISELTGSPRQAMEIMKENKVSSEDIARLRQGRIATKYSNLLSEKSIEQSGKFTDRDLTDEERKEAERDRKEAIKRLKLMNKAEGGK